MSVGFRNDLTKQYKDNVYHVNLEVSGWDTVVLQVLAPVAATLYVYGTINDGMATGQTYPSGNYGANKALDWQAVRCTALATGTAASSITTAGLYSVPVNFPYLRVGGGGANVYGLYQFNQKVT